jgi:2-polyprenyl-3-methyl-5-hydroxy-6-metoxy-1,4-benzoquinol methylase
MSTTEVTLILSSVDGSAACREAREVLERYLQSTGLTFQIQETERLDGAAVRAAWSETRGGVVVIVDAATMPPLHAVGDAVALIQSGAAEVVFGMREGHGSASAILRWLLVPMLPASEVALKAFSADAARYLIGESRLRRGFGLELAYLANKYGFRVEHVNVAREGGRSRARASEGFLRQLIAALAIRLIDRRNGYRSPRRCPICFSTEVWSCAQIPGDVIRACSRCKCRYRSHLADDEERVPVHRELRAVTAEREPLEDATPARSARERTSRRRLSTLRRHLPPRARVLEIGVRDGSFGAVATREFEYVGIDRAAAAARSARSRGLEVYCSTLAKFVNTGPAFDAVTLHHVFETLTDPHDALARIKELLKPGGTLLLSTFDTESLLFLLSAKRWMAQSFRTHAILYSRSALIELLEHSGFEVVTVGPEMEYRDHKFLRHLASSQWLPIAAGMRAALRFLPDPLIVSSGAIRIVARRRAGSPVEFRSIRSVEPTHAR